MTCGESACAKSTAVAANNLVTRARGTSSPRVPAPSPTGTARRRRARRCRRSRLPRGDRGSLESSASGSARSVVSHETLSRSRVRGAHDSHGGSLGRSHACAGAVSVTRPVFGWAGGWHASPLS
eukprot:1582193-Prymnesium_polylepis.1